MNICNNVAKLRREYQQKAFKPQFHDKGHESMIRSLIKMSDNIISLLSIRFKLEIESVCDLKDEIIEDSDDTIIDFGKMHTSTKNVKSAAKELLQSKLEWENELDMLIQVKSSYLAQIREIILLMIDKVNPLLKMGPISLIDREGFFIGATKQMELMYDDALSKMIIVDSFSYHRSPQIIILKDYNFW
jgi:hypothetical protein